METEKNRNECDKVVRSFDEEDHSDERKGFSLIELMVVIAIIAILSAIAVLSILHYRMVIRVDASARDLAGHMRICRANAIRDGSTWSFLYHGDLDRFDYGPNSNADANIDGRSYTYYLQPGIIFGFAQDTRNVPGHPDPTNPGGGVASCAVMTVANNDIKCLSDGVDPNYIHFDRNGTIFFRVSGGGGSFIDYPTDGVAYLIPEGDSSATGTRDDRQRAVDWIGTSGRIRLWRYDARNHEWF